MSKKILFTIFFVMFGLTLQCFSQSNITNISNYDDKYFIEFTLEELERSGDYPICKDRSSLQIFTEDILPPKNKDNSVFVFRNFLVAYKNSDQNSNLLIFHIYKYFFIYLIFNNITFKMYIQNYK